MTETIRCWHPGYYATETVCGGEGCGDVCPGGYDGQANKPAPEPGLHDTLQRIAAAEGGRWFLGWPDRWQEKPRWRCENDHVSTSYIGSERWRRAICAGCSYDDGIPIVLTFPEDRDGPLIVPEPGGWSRSGPWTCMKDFGPRCSPDYWSPHGEPCGPAWVKDPT